MAATDPAMTMLRVAPGGALKGSSGVPGDKSVTHRALICAALASGASTITGALDASDTRATAGALARLGADIVWRPDTVRVSCPAGQLGIPQEPLDLGNSGTGLRLLTGVLAGSGLQATLTGDASLRRRPMGRIIEPLSAMGARIESQGGKPPLEVCSGRPLHGIRYRLPVPSAQVKSALLLAGLSATGPTVIEDPFGTRDHTERLLPVFGARLVGEGDSISLTPGRLTSADVVVPGDFSSAAFLIAAALLTPGSEFSLVDVGVNPTRTGLLRVLERMGARIAVRSRRELGGEPVGNIRVTAQPLSGTRVAPSEIPALIDELPVLMVLAAVAEGATIIEGAGELRHKESDRIETMRTGLSALGVEMRVEGDTIVLPGGGFRHGGKTSSGGDHRVAMAFAVAGLAAPEPVLVSDAGWIATSFPDFSACLGAAGARLETVA